MTATCKNCVFWDEGYCDKEDSSDALFSIEVKVADDHGLYARLKTMPDFGCVQFEGREGN